jgi:hypothetical protein
VRQILIERHSRRRYFQFFDAFDVALFGEIRYAQSLISCPFLSVMSDTPPEVRVV